MGKTWIDPEEYCYPHGGFERRAHVILQPNEYAPMDLPYGQYRMVRAGIPDTFSTVPARLRYRGATIKGCISSDRGVLYFTPYPALEP